MKNRYVTACRSNYVRNIGRKDIENLKEVYRNITGKDYISNIGDNESLTHFVINLYDEYKKYENCENERISNKIIKRYKELKDKILRKI